MQTTITPLGAVLRGAAAGITGAAAMSGWFTTAGSLMPPPREGAFVPPDPEQPNEMPTETIARRTVNGLMRREIPEPAKKPAGQAVHFGFGAMWGAIYGLAAETFPIFRSPLGAAAFGAIVWSASDHLLLPAFRVGPWPNGVTMKGHAFWLATHLVYGAALAFAYASSRPKSLFAVALGAIGTRIADGWNPPTRIERARRFMADRLPVPA
jgi:hypothetical protein